MYYERVTYLSPLKPLLIRFAKFFLHTRLIYD